MFASSKIRFCFILLFCFVAFTLNCLSRLSDVFKIDSWVFYVILSVFSIPIDHWTLEHLSTFSNMSNSKETVKLPSGLRFTAEPGICLSATLYYSTVLQCLLFFLRKLFFSTTSMAPIQYPYGFFFCVYYLLTKHIQITYIYFQCPFKPR